MKRSSGTMSAHTTKMMGWGLAVRIFNVKAVRHMGKVAIYADIENMLGYSSSPPILR
jgi:hypothetical protein